MKTSLFGTRAIQFAACICISFNVALAVTSSGLIFTDITDQAVVAMPDDLTESVAWADYDNDGDPDIYLTNEGPDKLFRYDGNGDFTDVTEAAGLGAAQWSDAVAFGDFDNDGDLDFYAVNPDVGLDLVYRNDGGTFTDMSAFSLDGDTSSQRGICLLDYDHDGLVDIYVIAIGVDLFYRNLGNFQFEEVGKTVGAYSDGWGVGAVATDLNLDGWVDLFTSNRSGDPNRLYLNNNGTFDCEKSADFDDSNFIDLSDGINLMIFLFLGTFEPVAPFDSCGEDPTPDSLTCRRFPSCP